MSVIRFRFGCLSREGFDQACRRFLKTEPGLFPGQPLSSFCFLFKNVGYPDGTFGIKSWKAATTPLCIVVAWILSGKETRINLDVIFKNVCSLPRPSVSNKSREQTFPLLCLGGGVGQWVHGCNRCLLFSEKAWQVMVMMKINSLPLLSPFLWKTIFVRRPGNTSGGRDGSRALDRSFAVRDDRTESDRAFCYLSSHCSKNGAPNFFSPFVLFFTSSQRCHIC